MSSPSVDGRSLGPVREDDISSEALTFSHSHHWTVRGFSQLDQDIRTTIHIQDPRKQPSSFAPEVAPLISIRISLVDADDKYLHAIVFEALPHHPEVTVDIKIEILNSRMEKFDDAAVHDEYILLGHNRLVAHIGHQDEVVIKVEVTATIKNHAEPISELEELEDWACVDVLRALKRGALSEEAKRRVLFVVARNMTAILKTEEWAEILQSRTDLVNDVLRAVLEEENASA